MKSYLFVVVQFSCLFFILVTGPVIAGHPLFLCIELAGVAIAVWAVWAMKPGNVRATPDVARDAVLVTRGPYKYVRHPMYLALLLVTLALVLHTYSGLRSAAWVVLLIDILLKLSYEENRLHAHFQGYSTYRQRTKRLIPFIY